MAKTCFLNLFLKYGPLLYFIGLRDDIIHEVSVKLFRTPDMIMKFIPNTRLGKMFSRCSQRQLNAFLFEAILRSYWHADLRFLGIWDEYFASDIPREKQATIILPLQSSQGRMRPVS